MGVLDFNVTHVIHKGTERRQSENKLTLLWVVKLVFAWKKEETRVFYLLSITIDTHLFHTDYHRSL